MTPGKVGDAVLQRRRDNDRRMLGERVRVGLLILSVLTVGIALVVDASAHRDILWQLYAVKLVLFVAIAALWRISWSASRATLVRASAAMTVLVGAVTSVSSILGGEDWSAATLCVMSSTVVAGLIPWGVKTQLVVAPALLVLGMLPVILVGDGTKVAFIGMVSALLAVGSVFIAQEQEHFRRATWQGLLFFRENMERLRQIAEHINGVLWLGERGDWGESFLYVSPRYDELWGLDRAELQKRPDAWLDAVHPDDRLRVAESFRTGTMQRGVDCEYRLLRPNGTTSWIRDYGFPIRDVAGETRRLARLSQDVTAEKEAASAREMRELARSIQATREEERRRIARELHDELGQALTGIKLRLATCAPSDANGASPGTAAEVTTCLQEVDAAMGSVHAMIHRLHPPILDDLGLVAALRTQADTFVRRTGIVCEVELPDLEPELSDETLTAVFRVAQESLTNVARHAGATRVELRLSLQNDAVHLLVADDGRGTNGTKPGFGVRGMIERAALLNGSLRVEPRPERGTIVRLDLPRNATGACA